MQGQSGGTIELIYLSSSPVAAHEGLRIKPTFLTAIYPEKCTIPYTTKYLIPCTIYKSESLKQE